MFVYDLASLQLLGTVDKPRNPRGLAALTSCTDPACLLALPAEGGAVRVYDVGRGSVDALCQLTAHKSPVVSSGWGGGGGWVGWWAPVVLNGAADLSAAWTTCTVFAPAFSDTGAFCCDCLDLPTDGPCLGR